MTTSPRVIYAGTPEFAVPALQALISADVDIAAVYTQPDRPAGRGKKMTASPVKRLALEHELNIEQPESLKTDAAQQELAEYQADLMVVAAYGQILPPAALALPRLGCVNIHASLLPRWRGAAPIQRAIEACDSETGVTLMQMDAGLDTGAMLDKRSVPIASGQTAADLHDKLAVLGADMLLSALPALFAGSLPAEPQDESLVSYAKKITKAEAWVDWGREARGIAAQVNAFNPWPVAQTLWQGAVLRIWRAAVSDELQLEPDSPVEAGDILRADKTGIYVACGSGVLQVHQLQQAGGKVLTAAEFINSKPLSGSFSNHNAVHDGR